MQFSPFTRSWKFWLPTSAGILAVIIWLSPLNSTPVRELKKSNFSLVRTGMTMAQVEELLGGSAGDYGRFHNGRAIMTMEGFFVDGANEKLWFDDNCRFEIYFDEKETVVGTHKRALYSRTKYGLLERFTNFVVQARRKLRI